MKISKVVICMVIILSFITMVISANPWTIEAPRTYIPEDGESYFIGSSWGISTNNSLEISWYENPIEEANRWEAFILPLRIIKFANERLNTPIILNDKDIIFKTIADLDNKLVEDVNIMKKIGVLSSSNEGDFKFRNPVTKAEVAKILSIYNDYYFKISAKRDLINFSDIDNHWAAYYINNVYTSKIINGNSDGTFHPNDNITKEQLVQIVYNCLESNNITLEDVKKAVNYTYDVGPIINKNFLEPSNRNQYPYLISNVDKSIYERPYIVNDLTQFENPNFVYYDLKNDLYDKTKRVLEEYYNRLINVDYNTINEEDYYGRLERGTVYYLPKDGLVNYIQYLKDNKVVIKGKAIFQAPIIYYDGAVYRVRIKLDINIESAGEYINLLFLDNEKGNVTNYKQGNNVIYIDAPANGAIGTNVIYPLPRPIFSILTPE